METALLLLVLLPLIGAVVCALLPPRPADRRAGGRWASACSRRSSRSCWRCSFDWADGDGSHATSLGGVLPREHRLRRQARRRRDQPLARPADRLPHAAGDPGQLPEHHATRAERVLRLDAGAAGGDERRLRRARPAALLRLLRAHAHPDVLHHRHLGRAGAALRGGEILPLHLHRLGLHARGDHLPRD